MRYWIIGLLILLLLPVSCSSPIYTTTWVPAPTTSTLTTSTVSKWTPPQGSILNYPNDYVDIQVTLKPMEIYRVNVFVNVTDVIDYSWKTDEAIQFWYSTSIGFSMAPGNDSPMSLIPSDNPYYQPPVDSSNGGPLWAYGAQYTLSITGKYAGTGYYTFKFMPLSNAIKPVPLFFRYRVGKWTLPESTSTLPPTQQPQPTSTHTSSTPIGISPSDITSAPSAYDGKEVELLGQTFLAGSPPKLLIDGRSGINLAGNTANIQKGFYLLKGLYHADTNTLDVTKAVKQDMSYNTMESGAKSGVSLTAVVTQGLVATPPKEVAKVLTSYLSIPNLPRDMPIYPYVVYAKEGFYLALSDTLVDLPAKFTFLYQGKDYSFTFSAGEVKGTLIKTPPDKINLGSGWAPSEFNGVIIANTIAPLDTKRTTVKEINSGLDNFIFKRVSIDGSYLVTTATIDYSDIKAPMGQGILTDEFTDLFKDDAKARLETIDPSTKVWQLRRSTIIGTVIYPTDQILKYLDYSKPLSLSEVKQQLKPALIVDTIVDNVQQVANISELNPVTGNPSRYWGKVVEFNGYALGINYPLKQVAKAISNTDVPVNVNLLAVGIADKPAIGSQLAIIGLNNDLIGDMGEVIKGRYKFMVAVTQMPEQLATGLPGTDTAFFLLSKEALPVTATTTIPPTTSIPPLTTTPPTFTTTPPPQTTTPKPQTTTPLAPVLTHSWTVGVSANYLELKVTVKNIGSGSASGVYVYAGFDAGNNMLWNPQASPQFQLDANASRVVTIYLEPPYKKHTRLVVQTVYGGYAVYTSYSEWYDT